MSDLPRNAASLKAKAELAGWTVQVTHSDEHDSVALRLSRDGQRAAAVWKSGKFVGAYVLGRLREGSRAWPMPRKVGAREIAVLVEEKT